MVCSRSFVVRALQAKSYAENYQQNRQAQAAYAVSPLGKSINGALFPLPGTLQLHSAHICGKTGTEQQNKTEPEHPHHFSKNLIIVLYILPQNCTFHTWSVR